jgi:hypothetical protein
MNRLIAILIASGSISALSMPSWAQTKELTEKVTLSGTVEAIDQANRLVDIKTTDGKAETIEVPKSATRFDELKVGDKISISYYNDVFVRLKPPGEAAVNAVGNTTSTMGQEARPGGTAELNRTMTATVSTLDKDKSTITFVGPNNWKYSRRVADKSVFDKVKVGDRVDITWKTDVTISVQ